MRSKKDDVKVGYVVNGQFWCLDCASLIPLNLPVAVKPADHCARCGKTVKKAS